MPPNMGADAAGCWYASWKGRLNWHVSRLEKLPVYNLEGTHLPTCVETLQERRQHLEQKRVRGSNTAIS